jgi:hypothetical protein
MGDRLMPIRYIDRDAIGHDQDWEGNNAAFTNPTGNKVYVVSGHMHEEGRDCPNCGRSRGLIEGGKSRAEKPASLMRSRTLRPLR